MTYNSHLVNVISRKATEISGEMAMVVLRTKPRALYLLGKHSAIELVSLFFYLSPALIRNKY